jgi:LuxR family maltose regulon positive regulatory protein
MSADLLATKFFIPPPRANIVPRERLIKRLNEGLALRRKLTIISAAAGFGKSTLASEWIPTCGMPVAWLSLDPADSDPIRFITYLAAAVQTIQAGFGESLLATLQTSQSFQIESILIPLLNEIAAIPERFLLILDDYHAVDSQTVDQVLTFIIEHQPPQMHLVLLTREDPPWPLARLRARGQLTELRAADLRFDPNEAAEFLNHMMGLQLTDGDVAALDKRTEGWIAGLQLAALSMQGQSDPAGFIQSFTGSHRFVLDYLVEDVLERQSLPIQNFLLHTSILERMCGPLCESLLDLPAGAGQTTLEELEHANLFLIPLDNERRWYRYHHLFGELLRQRLGSPSDLPAYHLRASIWYEDNGDLTGAFQHALAAGDFERGGCLAEIAWQAMERNFQTAAWLGWVKKLPEEVINVHPRLCYQLGSAYSDAGDPVMSEGFLLKAERALKNGGDLAMDRNLRVNIALTRANNAQIQGNIPETVKFAELAIELAPEEDIYLRAQAVITLELLHWTTGDLEAALSGMNTWVADMQKIGNHVFALASAFAIADMLVTLGRLSDANQVLQQAIQQAEGFGREAISITAHHHLGLAMLAHERGEDAEKARHLQIAADLGPQTTLVDWVHRWNLAQARLKESGMEWYDALDRLEDARRAYVKTAIPDLQPIEAHKARVYLKQQRLDKAQAWAKGRNCSTDSEVHYLDEYEYITLARIRLAEGSLLGVPELLERLLTLAENQKRVGSMLEILLLLALIYQAQGNVSEAFSVLERALNLAEPEGYLRIFWDEGDPMRQLLADFRLKIARSAHPLLGYVGNLLSSFPSVNEMAQPPKTRNRSLEYIDPLSDRELEILRLIAAGYSNTEISQRLFLALSTIKGHNLRIFNKLQAQNRTEAVVRARELGLI